MDGSDTDRAGRKPRMRVPCSATLVRPIHGGGRHC